ncbi:MAG: ribonuclease H-like domain-containing protein [Calditrichia bacterium]|nr:ribonuclease H-like domain-containing protein [Calditrichia bacterium]
MNLKDKLKYFHKTVEIENVSRKAEEDVRRIPEHWIALARTTGGEIAKEKSGYFYYQQRIYDISLDPEFQDLKEKGFLFKNLQLLAPELKNQAVNLKDILFFDLETSGLAGGSGTIAFLIGAAHIFINHIVVHQWVMPDFADEYLILNHFNNLMDKYNYISTFNGKSFDAPVIKIRFILNQLIPELEDKVHIDLLHISRRLWKKRLQSCRLQNLEKEILCENRVEDIPGELIPSVYFSFLYGNGLEDFKKILEHNYLDLVNLVRIGIKLEYILSDPVYKINDETDFMELIRFLKKQKNTDLIEQILEERIKTDKDNNEILYEFALALKKNKKYLPAAEILKKLAAENYTPFELVEEYAKILEHNLKDYTTAIKIIEKKMNKFEIVEQLSGEIEDQFWEKLNVRLQRLRKKIKK